MNDGKSVRFSTRSRAPAGRRRVPRPALRAVPLVPGLCRPLAGRNLAAAEGRRLGPGARDDARGLPRFRAFRGPHASRSGWPGCGRSWPTTRPTSCGDTAARPSVRPAARCPSATRPTATRPGAPEPAAVQPTPSQEFLQLDTELRVTAALSGLPPDYQEVICSAISSGCRSTRSPSGWTVRVRPCRCSGCGRYGSCRRAWQKRDGRV